MAYHNFLRGSREGGIELLGTEDRMRGMAQSCTRGGSDWTLGKLLLPQGWSNQGTGFAMEVVSASCLSVFKRLLDSALNGMLFWLAVKQAGSWTR